MTARVTIVLPCRNEERYIGACLDSILATDYPRDHLELLVVDGQSEDRTREIVAHYAGRLPRLVRLLDNPHRVVPAGLNIGIRAATGAIIARMDAHVAYPHDYLTRLVAALETTEAANVGGCIATLPASESATGRAIAIALAHPFGVGNSYFRTGAPDSAPRWVDTVPFGCFRREVFDRVGLFDEDLVRNQDDEFNHRLLRHGERVLLLPDVVSTYYARETWTQLARMYFQYGYFKPLVARKLRRVMTLRQLAPPAFLLGLVSGLGTFFWPPAVFAWAAALLAYGALAAGYSLPAARRHGWRCAIALAVTFPILHLSYGCGFLRGAWDAFVTRHRWGSGDPTAVPLSR